MERTFTAGVSIVQLFANARAAGATITDFSRLTAAQRAGLAAADEARLQRNVAAARAAAALYAQTRHAPMPGMRFGGEEPQPATKVVSAHAGRPPLLPSGHYAMPGVSFGADAPVVRAHAGQARTAARSSTHAPMPGIQLGA